MTIQYKIFKTDFSCFLGYLTPDEVGRFQSLQEIRAVFSTKFENDFWPVKPVQIEVNLKSFLFNT